jgi:hypothetical protein
MRRIRTGDGTTLLPAGRSWLPGTPQAWDFG